MERPVQTLSLAWSLPVEQSPGLGRHTAGLVLSTQVAEPPQSSVEQPHKWSDRLHAIAGARVHACLRPMRTRQAWGPCSK